MPAPVIPARMTTPYAASPPTEHQLRVTSINLNGIRAAMKKGMTQWLEKEQPDVLLMQEVRADASIVEGLLGEEWATLVVPCQIKGRAGVAIAVRRGRGEILHLDAVNGVDEDAPRTYLYEDEIPVDSGRWVEASVKTPSGRVVRVIATYFHSGEKDTPKQEAKMEHLPRIEKRMRELLAGQQPVVVAGDFNIVRSERDIKNWKPNHNKSAGVLDEEIVFLDRWVTDGWVDVTRSLAGEDAQGPYTWWSWRGQAFANDAGWRIDYHFATPALAQVAEGFRVQRADSRDDRFSDHAPVTVDYAI